MSVRGQRESISVSQYMAVSGQRVSVSSGKQIQNKNWHRYNTRPGHAFHFIIQEHELTISCFS